MTPPFIALNRLRITRRGLAAYDHQFHSGVNIIRGENGSGKSTIADFIFYILGGEFESWKSAAKLCDEVQAEITTKGGLLTIKRAIGSKTTPTEVFFGPMEEASKHALDRWQRLPLHRTLSQESFSQIIFRASGIPEAPSEGASNITMHQIMRLLYSDQRTPATRIFRFEQWDTHDIREAVGNLVCGVDVYESYEIQLQLRELDKAFDEKQKLLSLRLAAIPAEEGLATMGAIELRVLQLSAQRVEAEAQIAEVDEIVTGDEANAFLEGRKRAVAQLNRHKETIGSTEQQIEKLGLEIADLDGYLEFLEELLAKLPRVEASSQIVGNIEFTHCPSCLTKLDEVTEANRCVVCGAERDPAREQSKYLHIKLDLEIQVRETRQLHDSKLSALNQSQLELRALRRTYDTLVSDFSVKYDLSSSPRDSFLAERYKQLGRIDRELEYVGRLRETVLEISRLSQEKADIQSKIEKLKDRQLALVQHGEKRRKRALTLVSTIAKRLLMSDLPRQPEFLAPQSVALKFRDDAIMVDDAMNFAESSNVVLKNSAILALFSAATMDEEFYHPRFVLIDNVEDKGMEVARSHNFQSLIIQLSGEARFSHQVIFTTSMMNPDFENEQFVIGPHYTHENRTLAIG